MRFIYIYEYDSKMKMNDETESPEFRVLAPFALSEDIYDVMTLAPLLKIRPDQMKNTAS